MAPLDDKQLAPLRRAITNGPLALEVGLGLGRGDLTFRNVARDVHRAATDLADAGRPHEAIAALVASRGQRSDPAGQLWDLISHEIVVALRRAQ